MKKKAVFSIDRKYRYFLKRSWDSSKPSCCFICLNPSIADEINDDKMVTRCIKQAKIIGFGSIEMVNLFAYIDTNRNTFYSVSDPVGLNNDDYLLRSAKRCETVIVAWGNEGTYKNRSDEVLYTLKNKGIEIFCLMKNLSGLPRHPGRMKYVEKLERFG